MLHESMRVRTCDKRSNKKNTYTVCKSTCNGTMTCIIFHVGPTTL